MKPLWLEITLEEITILLVLFSSLHLDLTVQEQLLVPEDLWSLDELSLEHHLSADHNSGYQLHGLQVGRCVTGDINIWLSFGTLFRKLIEHAAQNILYQSPERKTNIRLQQEVNPKANTTYYNSIIQYIHIVFYIHIIVVWGGILLRIR